MTLEVDYYGDVAGADEYHAVRNHSGWSDDYTDDQKLAAIIVASEWIDRRWALQFPGTKPGMRAQVREWPRVGVTDYYGYPIPPTEVPREVESAVYEAALRELKTPGCLNTDVVMAKTYQSVSIANAVAVVYAGAGSSADLQLLIPIVDEILAPILTGRMAGYSSLSGGSVRV